MVGYFVKTLWKQKLICSSRFQNNKHKTFLLQKNTTSPPIQFDILCLSLACGQTALTWVEFWFSRECKFNCSRWDDFPALCPFLLSANQLLCFCSCFILHPFKVKNLSPSPSAYKWFIEHTFAELCARHCLGAGNKAVNETDNSCLHRL